MALKKLVSYIACLYSCRIAFTVKKYTLEISITSCFSFILYHIIPDLCKMLLLNPSWINSYVAISGVPLLAARQRVAYIRSRTCSLLIFPALTQESRYFGYYLNSSKLSVSSFGRELYHIQPICPTREHCFVVLTSLLRYTVPRG
jgi:hypothetical protein